MVKFYNKIANDDFIILKQILHQKKENLNENEQWINMDDFINNSINRNNLYRNDYINNILPRIRDLIKIDEQIEEYEEFNINEHQKNIFWREK